MIMQCR